MAASQGMKGGGSKDVDTVEKQECRSASESTVEDFLFVACAEVKREPEEAANKEVGTFEESCAECEVCIKEEMIKAGSFEEISVPGCNVHIKKEVEEFMREPQTKKKRTKEIEKDLATFTKTCTVAPDTRLTNADDCNALGNYISAKLCKMNDTQQILAEALIQKIITRGMRNHLTDNTDLCESPGPHVFAFPYISARGFPYAPYGSPLTGQSASPATDSYSGLGGTEKHQL